MSEAVQFAARWLRPPALNLRSLTIVLRSSKPDPHQMDSTESSLDYLDLGPPWSPDYYLDLAPPRPTDSFLTDVQVEAEISERRPAPEYVGHRMFCRRLGTYCLKIDLCFRCRDL